MQRLADISDVKKAIQQALNARCARQQRHAQQASQSGTG
jgi:hypothetical protein